MGKEFHEQAVDVELESYHDHNDDPGCMGAIFDYHHWYNVKKMFPHRKYNRGRHGRCCGNPRTISMERKFIETQVLLHAEADHLQQTRKTGSTTNKTSNNDYTMVLTGKEKHKQRIPSFSATPLLQQTYSTHPFEHSGFGFGWIIPIILVSKRAHTTYSSSTSPGAYTMPSKKLEIHDRMNSGKHAMKLNREVSYSRVKEGLDVLEVLKINKDLFLDPGVGISQHVPVAGTESSQGSDSQRWNSLVMNRFKDFKQRIKQTIKQISIKDVTKKCQNEDGTDNDICNGGLNRMRGTKLMNKTLDRHAKLFETGVSKEADWHQSTTTSLSLSKQDQVPSREHHGPEIFRSISSLSDMDPFRSLLHTVSRDALSLEMPIGSILNYDARNEPKSINVHEDIDKFELVEAVIEAELQDKMREGNNRDSSSTNLSIDLNGEDIAKPCDLAMEKISPRQEQESAFEDNSSRELTRPISEGKLFLPGLGLNHPNLPEGETESYTFLKERPSMFFESNKEGDHRYVYVRDILELSGLLQNEGLHSWHSPDQPLNPSLFNELETLLHPELECSSIDELETSCDDDHRLVFDLVNEALAEIGQKTSIYFPKPFNCSIGLMSKGNIVVQEVWRKVSSNLAFQREHDRSLDDNVSRDFQKDAWMMLEGEAEFVALELEDFVLDELVDEVFCL